MPSRKFEPKKKEDFFGYCCTNQPKYRILYNGSPRPNYIVLVCETHFKTQNFNSNILKVESVKE